MCNDYRSLVDLSLFGAEHVRRYRETGGEVGYVWNGAPTLLLTTTGRRTGDRRTTPLIFGRDGERYVVVASQGGAPRHPSWYLNLSADPDVELQVKDEVFAARARTAEPEERGRLWELMTAIWPHYDAYQQKTDREIPVAVLGRE